MNRRDFLRLAGIAAGAVTLGGVSALATPEVLDAPFVVGDVFTIQGYNAINPVTGRDTVFLQTFVITAVTANSVDFFPKFADIPSNHRKTPLLAALVA